MRRRPARRCAAAASAADAMRQRQQRQFAAAALAGGRARGCPAGSAPRRPRRARFTPIQVPPPERSRPATTPGRSGQCAAGGSQARSSISSRLAASTSGQAWPGRISRTTVHITADDGVGSGHTSQPAMSVNFRIVRRSDGMIVGRDNMSRFASFATKYPASIMRGADLRGYGPDMEGLALMRQLDR